MPEFQIFKAKDDLERCYPVMKELRTALSFNEYMEIYELGKKFYERHNWKLRAVAYKKKLSLLKSFSHKLKSLINFQIFMKNQV